MPRTRVIDTANEHVSIITVCRMLGMDLPEGEYLARRKVHCPFGDLYHSDGGRDPAMRIYADGNFVYCFNCQVKLSPVALAARALDLDWRTAAVRLLDRVGYRPLDVITQFEQARDFAPPLNRALLADALKTYCRRIHPAWGRLQFDRTVAASLTRCLSLLDLVRTPDDVTMWLSRCKELMARTLSRSTSFKREPGQLSSDQSARGKEPQSGGQSEE